MAGDEDEDDPRKGIPTKSEVKQHPGDSDSTLAKRDKSQEHTRHDETVSEKPRKGVEP